MKYKKSEDKLIRFVWSRRIEYDFLLLLEVQAKNPYAFKNSKPIWQDIAKNLQMSELKMKVTDRSCRERVNELLKKFRKEEGLILRSTGATHDKITEIKNLLIIINEMALTKPQAIHSNLYTKRARTEGESIRDAALRELSDSESDDYIHGKYSRGDSNGDSRKRPHNNEEIEHVTGVNGYFNDDMTLEEENLMDQELLREAEETQGDVNTNEVLHVLDEGLDSDSDSNYNDRQTDRENETQALPSRDENQSWMDIPTGSRDYRYSIPLDCLGNSPPQPANMRNSSATQASSTATTSAQNDTTSTSLTSNNRLSNRLGALPPQPANTRNSSATQASSSATTSAQNETTPTSSTSNNRFSNPKKDLVGYLNTKTANELIIRREEIRIRALEVDTKKQELDILRLKTEAEIEERMKCREIEAQNKKEELQILRLKTEAEVQERKQIQDLLITLLTKDK